MNRVKIAHVTTVDYSLRDLLLSQLQSLTEAGFDVFGISSPGAQVATLQRNGIAHIPVPMSRNIAPIADLVALARLYKIMRRERFSIVHTHTPKAGLLGQLAAKAAGGAIIVNTIHGFYFHEHMSCSARRFYIGLEKVSASCSDLILSQNLEDVQTALSEGICKPAQIRYLGNGIDVRMFDPSTVTASEEARLRSRFRIPAGAPVIGFVGRLAGIRKGFRDFLAAAKLLTKQFPAVRFLIVGEPDRGKPDALDEKAADHFGVAENCLFVGQISNIELPAVYKLMNVLVLPSLFEGVPRVVMEASAMGIPCVVSDVKGNRDAVFSHRTGLLVPFGDVKALAEAVASIVKNPDLASGMSRAARLIAAEFFDERLVFERIQKEYVRLLKEKGHR